jgi:hypothetical protein
VTKTDFGSSLDRYMYSVELRASGGEKIVSWIYLLLAFLCVGGFSVCSVGGWS